MNYVPAKTSGAYEGVLERGGFTPTLIYPFKESFRVMCDIAPQLGWALHIVWWLATFVLTVWAANIVDTVWRWTDNLTDLQHYVGTTGVVCQAIGIGFILFLGGMVKKGEGEKKNEYQFPEEVETGWLKMVILPSILAMLGFLSVALSCNFYLATEAFKAFDGTTGEVVPDTSTGSVGAFAVLLFLNVHSLMWLYSNLAALETKMLVRLMIPALILGLDVVAAIVIYAETLVPVTVRNIAATNCAVAFVILVGMWLLRVRFNTADSLRNEPFKRSVIMTLAMYLAVSTSYLVVLGGSTPASLLLQPAMIGSYILLVVALNPDATMFP